MTLDIFDISGQKTGRTVELPTEIFGVAPNEHAVYLTVKQYLANQRQGTHKTKERWEVSRSTRKLKKQKGTGGARAGDMKSPIWKGGGTVFGPKPHEYNLQVNKKVRALARKSVLSSKAAAGELMVIEDFTMDTPKTKAFSQIVSNLNLSDAKALFVTNGTEKNIYLSSRNIPNAAVANVSDLNTYEIMNADKLVISLSSLTNMVAMF
jgi:large subunit ribosomal protein L4